MAKKGLRKIEEFVHLGKADLHIHSNYSDGKPSVEEILDYVQEKTDLDVIAISDHDTLEGALKAAEIMKTKSYRFDLVIAEEITAKEGHILGLFLKKPIPRGLPAIEVLRQIHRQAGFAIACHPFERTRLRHPTLPTMNGVGLGVLLKIGDKFDGIETINATPTLSEKNLRASLINSTLLIKAETGASDAHIPEAIGMGYTLFEGKTASQLYKALIHHQTRAMHEKWTVMALIKYFYFFLPRGLRMVINTLIHGRQKNEG